MVQGSNLKGLILSGGTGSRLRPFTYSTAKQLLPLANKPVIFYVVEAMVDAGITDIGVIVGHTGAQIEAHLGDGSKFGARLTYIEQDAPRGLAHAVQTAREFLGDDPFAVFLGDNFLKGGIRSHVEAFHQSGATGQILLKRVDNPREFGIAELDAAGRLQRLVEKPTEPASDLAVLGVYLLRPEFFAAAATITPSFRGELEITDALQAMLDAGHDLRGHVIDDDWVDTGGPEDLLRANRTVLDHQQPCLDGLGESCTTRGNVRIEPGASITGTQIEGPAIIGHGAVIRDTYVGPGTSIGPRVQVTGARIEHSIVMEDAVIEGARIRDSIIGRHAHVRVAPGFNPESKADPESIDARSFKVLLGDNGRLELE
jgi:glucose-1-phosphate thymidylyltransferase